MNYEIALKTCNVIKMPVCAPKPKEARNIKKKKS